MESAAQKKLESRWVKRLDSSETGYDVAQVTVPMHKLSEHRIDRPPMTDEVPRVRLPIPSWVIGIVAFAAVAGTVLGYVLGRMPQH